MIFQIKNFLNVKNLIVLLILTSGIFLRISVSKIGYNFDMESWDVVRYIVSSKSSVYSNTQRYNYGPVWSYTIFFLNYLFKPLGTQGLHLILSGFMCILDILIFFILYRCFNLLYGALYLLNPAVILITGFHIQIDNFAILFGLMSWVFINKAFDEDLRLKDKNILIFSMVLMGVSLSIKHILIFFPIALGLYLLKFDFKNIQERLKELTLLTVPYMVFWQVLF